MEKPILAAFLSVEGTSLSDFEKNIFAKYNPLGVSLFKRNVEGISQLKKLTAEIKRVIGRDDVLIAVDQEGGRVRRLGEPDFRAYAGQQTLGRIAEEISEQAAEIAVKNQADLISDDLHKLGINLNYAPVLDVLHENTSAVLASRIFSSQPENVAKLGKIMLDEYMKNGIIPCIKHMPGHGLAQVDPHLHLPVILSSMKELEVEFLPFQKLNYAPMGMTAHIIIAEVDDEKPITQSKKAISQIIRGAIGFDGFLVSDSIDMHALGGTIGERAASSVAAGCDAVCYCAGKPEELEAVCLNAGFLNDKALQRLSIALEVLDNKQNHDISKLEAEYNKILGKIEPYQENYDATEVLFQMQKKNK